MLIIDIWAHQWGIPAHVVQDLKARICPMPELIPDIEGQTESDVQALLRLKASEIGDVLFRNNSGAMQDDTGRVVRFGLGNDSKRIQKVRASSDLIGITSVVISQKHVGSVLGIFTAPEVKKPGWTSPNPIIEREVAQATFINMVISHGGLAGFCTSTDDYLSMVNRIK